MWQLIKSGARRAKRAIHYAIARHRGRPFIKALHGAASFFETAWHNEGVDFDNNGEKFVLERLAAAQFRLAVDVGAHYGRWTRSALQFWPHCHVHAFEVAPETFKLLERGLSSQRQGGRAELHDVGLSDRVGRQTMYYVPGAPDLTSDRPRHDGSVILTAGTPPQDRRIKSVPFDARLTTLDSFCRERGIEAIDFLKVDVEGAEHLVLKGARDLLQAGRIACVQFEYGAFSIDTRFLLRDYFALLSDHYVIGKIFPNNVAFQDYDWRADDFRFSNYLCISRSRSDLRQLLK